MKSPILPVAHRGLSLTVLAVLVGALVAATGVVVWLYLDAAMVAVPLPAIPAQTPVELVTPVSKGVTRLIHETAPVADLRGS